MLPQKYKTKNTVEKNNWKWKCERRKIQSSIWCWMSLWNDLKISLKIKSNMCVRDFQKIRTCTQCKDLKIYYGLLIWYLWF